jgi:hypothetical protein
MNWIKLYLCWHSLFISSKTGYIKNSGLSYIMLVGKLISNQETNHSIELYSFTDYQIYHKAQENN